MSISEQTIERFKTARLPGEAGDLLEHLSNLMNDLAVIRHPIPEADPGMEIAREIILDKVQTRSQKLFTPDKLIEKGLPSEKTLALAKSIGEMFGHVSGFRTAGLAREIDKPDQWAHFTDDAFRVALTDAKALIRNDTTEGRRHHQIIDASLEVLGGREILPAGRALHTAKLHYGNGFRGI